MWALCAMIVLYVGLSLKLTSCLATPAEARHSETILQTSARCGAHLVRCGARLLLTEAGP